MIGQCQSHCEYIFLGDIHQISGSKFILVCGGPDLRDHIFMCRISCKFENHFEEGPLYAFGIHRCNNNVSFYST